MSFNSSSSNTSLHTPPPHHSVNIHNFLLNCFNSTAGVFNITAFTVTVLLLLLPLCILVLYLGYKRWRQQHSCTMMSHSDVFTYHMIITELMSVFGFVLTCCAVHTDLTELVTVGSFLHTFKFSGQMFFHILTCVDRYLAVVHPVTYLGLRQAKGIRLRNISIGCVWLLCFAGLGVSTKPDHVLNIVVTYSFLSFTVIVISFCSISVLCVLIRPGPGGGGEDRQRVDQSKLRAFYTIMVILGVLVLKFGGVILASFLYSSRQLGETEICGVTLSESWYSLPSSLVLPLLFLHRAGKLSCCRTKNTSGEEPDYIRG